MTRKLPTGDQLTKLAESLGISLDGLYSDTGIRDEPELQRRVLEAELALREASMRRLAVISAIAAVASAVGMVGAWLAVCEPDVTSGFRFINKPMILLLLGVMIAGAILYAW